jgi:hypothetical protein
MTFWVTVTTRDPLDKKDRKHCFYVLDARDEQEAMEVIRSEEAFLYSDRAAKVVHEHCKVWEDRVINMGIKLVDREKETKAEVR